MTGPNQNFEEKLKALRDEFEARLPGRIEELDTAFEKIQPDGGAESRQALENLMALAHKLSGAAGTFGFIALGQTAEKLENTCQGFLDDQGKLAADEHEELAALMAVVHETAEKGPD